MALVLTHMNAYCLGAVQCDEPDVLLLKVKGFVIVVMIPKVNRQL